jgi:sn-glycerol 3-phosphate transport system substrate-binding protein
MRRPARFVGAVFVLALMVTACGGGDDGTSSPDTGGGGSSTAELPECPIGALDSATEPVEVVLWHFLQGKTGEALQLLADEFNASQDKVVVRVESQGTTNDEVWNKYRSGIPSGDLPSIAVLDDTVTAEIAASGTVLPATSCIEADNYDTSEFLPAAMDYYTLDGVLYPASVNLSGALLYYNENHFRAASLDPADTPDTLDEVRQYAQQIKDAGVVDRPVILKVGPPLIEMWLTGAGQPIVDNDNGRGSGETTAAAFDTEVTTDLFTWVKEMDTAGLLTVVPDLPGQIDQYLAMASQSASMTIETSTAATTIEAFLQGDTDVAGAPDDLAPADVDLSQLAIGAAEVPGIDEPGRLQMGGGAWYISTAGTPEQQAGAWEFMKFFNSVDSQVTWNVEASYLPYRTTAVDSPIIQQRWTETVAGRWLAIAYDELLNGVDPDFPGPIIGPYDQFRVAVRRAVDSMVVGSTSPADAVAQAAADTTAAIEQYNNENF